MHQNGHENTAEMIGEVCTVLKEDNKHSVTDATVDDLCKNVSELLTLWENFFRKVRKPSPSDHDIAELKEMITKAVRKHREQRHGFECYPKSSHG